MEREGRSYQTRGGSGFNKSRAEPEFLLQWGSRKRLRCVKIQVKDAGATERTMVRVDRRVVGADKESTLLPLRRPSSLRILRNSEASIKFQQRQLQMTSLERAQEDKKAVGKNGVSVAVSSEWAPRDEKKVVGNGGGGGGGSSSGSEGGAAAAAVWPKFALAIALTTREKEEDFMAFKGTKLPQRPKKRSKLIQRTLNLVCPGSWLSDLTQERYEVQEKKAPKKRPRGLKAMGSSMESDSE